MSEESVKKSKGRAGSDQKRFGSRGITQIICFAIVATAAVFAFVQARRALYGSGDSLIVSTGDKYSQQSDEEGVEVNSEAVESDDGNASADSSAGQTEDSPSSTAESDSSLSEKSQTPKGATETTKTFSDCMVKITATPVNVRSGAGNNYKVIEKTSRGKTFTLLASEKKQDGKEWYQIVLPDNKRGWVLSSCCQILDKKDTTTTASTEKVTSSTTSRKTTAATEDGWVEIKVTPVKIRAEIGTDSKVLLRTKEGKVYKLLSRKKDSEGAVWYKIKMDDGREGWVKGSFCRLKDSPETTASTTSSTTSSKTTKTTKTTSSAVSTTATTAAATTKADDSLIMKLQPSARKAKYFIVVYKGSQSVVVYGKDKNEDYTKQVMVFTCSTGKKSSPTRTGKYHIRAKYRWRWLVGNVYGQYNSSISAGYLFHSVPYLKQKASTLEDEEYDKLGSPASKGCIRMCVRDCKWIYDNCEVGTDVRIVDDSGPEGPGVPKRNTDEKYNGWDPSDLWAEGNPYFFRTTSQTKADIATSGLSGRGYSLIP